MQVAHAGKRLQKDVMIGQIVRDQHNTRHAGGRVGMHLKGRIPEVLRVAMLAGEESDFWRFRITRERERERNLDRRAVGPLAFAFEIIGFEIADFSCAEFVCVGAPSP